MVLTVLESPKKDLFIDTSGRGKMDFYCDKQVEVGSDRSQLRTEGFMERRKKWRY